MFDDAIMISCDEGEKFVLTKLGFDRMPPKLQKEHEVGKPLKGLEKMVPEKLYARGYFEKIDEE